MDADKEQNSDCEILPSVKNNQSSFVSGELHQSLDLLALCLQDLSRQDDSKNTEEDTASEVSGERTSVLKNPTPRKRTKYLGISEAYADLRTETLRSKFSDSIINATGRGTCRLATKAMFCVLKCDAQNRSTTRAQLEKETGTDDSDKLYRALNLAKKVLHDKLDLQLRGGLNEDQDEPFTFDPRPPITDVPKFLRKENRIDQILLSVIITYIKSNNGAVQASALWMVLRSVGFMDNNYHDEALGDVYNLVTKTYVTKKYLKQSIRPGPDSRSILYLMCGSATADVSLKDLVLFIAGLYKEPLAEEDMLEIDADVLTPFSQNSFDRGFPDGFISLCPQHRFPIKCERKIKTEREEIVSHVGKVSQVYKNKPDTAETESRNSNDDDRSSSLEVMSENGASVVDLIGSDSGNDTDSIVNLTTGDSSRRKLKKRITVEDKVSSVSEEILSATGDCNRKSEGRNRGQDVAAKCRKISKSMPKPSAAVQDPLGLFQEPSTSSQNSSTLSNEPSSSKGSLKRKYVKTRVSRRQRV